MGCRDMQGHSSNLSPVDDELALNKHLMQSVSSVSGEEVELGRSVGIIWIRAYFPIVEEARGFTTSSMEAPAPTLNMATLDDSDLGLTVDFCADGAPALLSSGFILPFALG